MDFNEWFREYSESQKKFDKSDLRLAFAAGQQKAFGDPVKDKKLAWIVNYVIEENFSARHLNTLTHIVGLFNECEEAEIEIFDFARYLYAKYAQQERKTMNHKKYIVLAWNDLEAAGGLWDIVGSYDTMEEARAQKFDKKYDYCQIVERDTWKIRMNTEI